MFKLARRIDLEANNILNLFCHMFLRCQADSSDGRVSIFTRTCICSLVYNLGQTRKSEEFGSCSCDVLNVSLFNVARGIDFEVNDIFLLNLFASHVLSMSSRQFG